MSRWKRPDGEVQTKTLTWRKWSETDGGKKYKEGRKDYAKQWRERNPEKKKEIQKRSYYFAKLRVLRHYSEKEIPDCKCCQENIFEFLQLDHVEGNGADHRRSIGMAQGNSAQVQAQTEKTGKKPNIGGNGFLYWVIKNNFPEGLQVLCANCNYSKRNNKYCIHELNKGVDMHGNKIPKEFLPQPLPELTRRRRGEAQKEAEQLGISAAALRMRRWKAKNPKPKKEKEISTHCKNGHAYADGNLYEWKGHRQCRQCKRDYKARIKVGE